MATKKKRTAKQIAATKRMLAANRKKHGKKTARKKSTVRKSIKKVVRKKHIKKEVPTMARKRKSGKSVTSHKTARRRHSSGGIGGKKGKALNIIKDMALAVGGGVIAGIAANKLPIPNPKMKAAAPFVAGLALAMTIGRKNELAHHFATGMMVLGGVALVRAFAPNVPLLAGEEELSVMPSMLGYDGEGYGDYSDGMSGKVDLGEEEEVYLTPASM